MDAFLFYLGLQAEANALVDYIARIFTAGAIVFVGVVFVWVVLSWRDSEA